LFAYRICISYHICIDTFYMIRNTEGYSMAREGITFQQVAAAAEALVGEGQQPTIRSIRDKLGSGSPNTVHKHLAVWRESRPVAAATAPELPQALTAAIAAEIKRAAAQARAEVEHHLTQALQEASELANAGEMIETELKNLAEQVVQLTRERDTLAGKTEQQTADLADQAQRIDREQRAAESARIDLATARVKIETQAEQQTTQAAEIECLRAALESNQKARIAAEQQSAVLTAKLEAASVQLTQQAEAYAEVRKQASQAAQIAAEHVTQTQAERDEARKRAADAREQAARLAGQLETLTAQAHKAHGIP
jgi:colicin import membrane protein